MEKNTCTGDFRPRLRVMSAKSLGTKLDKLKQAEKLLGSGASSCLLKPRAKYIFLLGEADLELQLFTWQPLTGPLQNVTNDYFNHDTVFLQDQGSSGYTLCSMQLTTKTGPLLGVWRSRVRHVLYYALFHVQDYPQPVDLTAVMQRICAQYNLPAMPCVDLSFQLTRPVTLEEWQHEAMDEGAMELDPNTHAVGVPVVYINNQPQTPFQRRLNSPRLVVDIVATELGRKWTWEAEVNEQLTKIAFKELYMRGGQACNSVLTRCKAQVYALYPDCFIDFNVTIQPRRKEQLKVTGQKLLDRAMKSVGADLKAMQVTKSEPYGAINTNNLAPITITMFMLEHPPTEQDQCWIALVCDDQRQVAFEGRHKDVHELIALAEKHVRDNCDSNAVFVVDWQTKKPNADALRNRATAQLESATARRNEAANNAVVANLKGVTDWVLKFLDKF